MKRRSILHRNEKELIRVLHKEGVPMTVHEAADYSGMSWLTAKKYLRAMKGRGITTEVKEDKRTKFAISQDLIDALQERSRDEDHQ